MAVHLARAGHLTLTMDYGFDDRSEKARLRGRDPVEVLDCVLRLHGRSVLGDLVEDGLMALDWLASHPDVHHDRLGLFGHSLGAAVALHTALLYESPVPVCATSHLGSYATMYERLSTWDQSAALPGILCHADLADLYGALAPARLQLQHGTDDPYLDRVDARAAGCRVQAAYIASRAAGAAEVLELPMGHGTAVEHAVRFFRDALATASPQVTEVPAARIGFDGPARRRILELVDTSLASGILTLGPIGAQLEQLAQDRIGRETATVSSGSAALEIALRIVGVEGRTVLVPANTFFATAASAIRAGARVDFVDMELDGLGMDPSSLRAAIAVHDDVAAVIPVHIAGVVSPALADVLKACDEGGIAVVEDAAHALGSSLDGRPAGAFGRLAAFSFYPTKVITTAEGGLVVGPGQDLQLARGLRDQGKRSFTENLHASLGSNWRMSELHAAVGVTHLAMLDRLLAERQQLATWYDDRLGGVDFPLTAYVVPPRTFTNYYKYVAYLPDGVDRAELRRRLRKHHSVALSGEVYDTLLPDQPFFAHAFAGRTFKNAEWFAAHHVCLPIFPGMTRRQQERVAAALESELRCLTQ